MKPNNPVTPEMLEAGANAVYLAEQTFNDHESTALNVYLAMVEQGPDVEAIMAKIGDEMCKPRGCREGLVFSYGAVERGIRAALGDG